MTTEVTVNDFIKHVGPNVDINPLVAREIDYFYELIPESYFEEKAKQTNLYHYQFWPAKGVEHAGWMPACAEELKAHLGCVIIMGIHPNPPYTMHCSMNRFLGNEGKQAVMSRAKFEELNRYMHLNDNTKLISRGQEEYPYSK